MGGAKLNPSNLCRANTKIFNLIEYKETIPKLAYTVTPAQAGVQAPSNNLDSGFRRNDDRRRLNHFQIGFWSTEPVIARRGIPARASSLRATAESSPLPASSITMFDAYESKRFRCVSHQSMVTFLPSDGQLVILSRGFPARFLFPGRVRRIPCRLRQNWTVKATCLIPGDTPRGSFRPGQ